MGGQNLSAGQNKPNQNPIRPNLTDRFCPDRFFPSTGFFPDSVAPDRFFPACRFCPAYRFCLLIGIVLAGIVRDRFCPDRFMADRFLSEYVLSVLSDRQAYAVADMKRS